MKTNYGEIIYKRRILMTIEQLIKEIKDYFRNQQDEDYLAFDDHPLADVESLMDPNKPAPWDHLDNEEDDGDVDVDIEEKNL